MPRLIDLDRLLEFPVRLNHYDKEHGDINFVYGIETVLEYAENLPITDVSDINATNISSIKHGKWIFKKRTKLVLTDKVGIKEGYRTVTDANVNKAVMILKKRIVVKIPYCSICGDHGDDEGDAMPYCPNCGAKMDLN